MNSLLSGINLTRMREALQQLGRFTAKDYERFSARLKALTVPKNSCLLEEGTVCQSFYFIVNGSFRQYQVLDTGDEITHNLYLDNEWLLDYHSFTSQQPSSSSIQATADSEVVELSVYDLHHLIKTSDAFFQLGRIFHLTVEHQGLQLQRQFPTPKERYLFLLANKPQVIQRFPLKHIASYLGMTPETLSRVRRSLAS